MGSYGLVQIQLPDKVPLGSDALHGLQKEFINMARDLSVAEAVRKKWLGENAVRFLELVYQGFR